MSIAQNVASVREATAAAAVRSGRSSGAVRVLAVTKTVPTDRISEAIVSGQLLFGENYVQEARTKIATLRAAHPEAPFEFDFIGRLQRNKAADAVSLFGTIQTIDRVELARAVQTAAEKQNKIQRVLLQVNISDEESKSGASVGDLPALLNEVLGMKSIRVEGLMCIGSYFDSTEPDELRRSEFRRMRSLRDELQQSQGHPLPELSMGMSGDFVEAAEEGATIVRIGSAIFGERPAQ